MTATKCGHAKKIRDNGVEITGKYFFLLFLYGREYRDTESKNDIGSCWATYIYKKIFSKNFSRNAPPTRGRRE